MPFLEHAARRQRVEDIGVGVRMAADQVTAAAQPPDVGGREKRTDPEQVGDDEEVSPPAARAQRVGDVQRAPAAVVEREQQVAAGRGEIDVGDELWGDRARPDRVEIAGETRDRVLEGHRARALKARDERIVRDVVIAQTRDLEPGAHDVPRAAATRGRRRSSTGARSPLRACKTDR